jgi:hypothetical protein
MQPSNQLKGLVESYNSVYANRQELEEAKVVAEKSLKLMMYLKSHFIHKQFIPI